MQNERFERRPLKLITGPRRAIMAGIALFGFSAGVLATACEGYDRDLTSDQQVAAELIKESEQTEHTIRIIIVNPENPTEAVNARSSPAVLDNWVRELKPGKEFDAIVVKPAEGYQQAEGDYSLWVAVDPFDGQPVFINSAYVARKDGQPLTLGVQIQETRPDRPDVLQPIGNAQ